MQKPPRPIGVTIISILAILTGVLGMIVGISIAAFSSLFAGIGFGVGGLLAGIGYIIGGVIMFFGLIWLLCGWGFLTGKGWARTIGLIFSILSLLGLLLIAATGSISGIVGVVMYVVILYYLFTPPVKQFFGASPAGTGGSTFNASKPSTPGSFNTSTGGSSFGSSSFNTGTSNTSNPSSYGSPGNTGGTYFSNKKDTQDQ